MIPTYLRRLVFFAACAALARAVAPESTVTGTTVDPASGQPAEFVAVTLKKADGVVVQLPREAHLLEMRLLLLLLLAPQFDECRGALLGLALDQRDGLPLLLGAPRRLGDSGAGRPARLR